MTEASVTNDAENDRHEVEESREDSTEVSSRMEGGNTPVGGPLVPAGVSSRSEGGLSSGKRGSEERGAPEPDVGAYGRVGNVHQRDASDALSRWVWLHRMAKCPNCSAETDLAVQLSTGGSNSQ